MDNACLIEAVNQTMLLVNTAGRKLIHLPEPLFGLVFTNKGFPQNKLANKLALSNESQTHMV